MPVFPRPKFAYTVHVAQEREALRSHAKTRAIPKRTSDHLLIASWNIANFGAQERQNDHIELLAEIVSWFDVVALQEVRSNYTDLERLVHALPRGFRYIMSDVAGNDERVAFVYRTPKLQLLELVGEIAVPPSDHRYITLPGVTRAFTGFDRNPYLVGFSAGPRSFLFANVHLYFGSQGTKARQKASMERRCLEAYAVARWADLERKSKWVFTREIIALGDMNMPKLAPTDPVFKAITRRGMVVPAHSAKVASAIASDSEYDQLAIFPGETQECVTAGVGVFDFDQVLFRDLWQSKTAAQYKGYLKYYVSDHRPIWVEMAL